MTTAPYSLGDRLMDLEPLDWVVLGSALVVAVVCVLELRRRADSGE